MAKNLEIISREIFYFFSSLLVVFIVLEIIFPNIILSYLNINYIFVMVFVSGLFSLIKK